MTRFQLLQRKLGMVKVKDSYAMAKGRALEDSVLTMVARRLGAKGLKTVTCESLLYPWMVAQIDGFNDDLLVEIKCPSSPKLLREIASFGIPPHYDYQLQAQMLVTGRLESIFCVYFEQNLRLWKIQASKDVQALLVDSSKQFLEGLQQARQGNGLLCKSLPNP